MKKLIMLGLLAATVAFSGTAFADGNTLQDIELQKLFEWSAQAAEQAKTATQTAGPGARATTEVPPVLEYRGSGIR